MKALKEAEELAKNNDHITLDIYNNGFFTKTGNIVYLRDKNDPIYKVLELQQKKSERDSKRLKNGFKKLKQGQTLENQQQLIADKSKEGEKQVWKASSEIRNYRKRAGNELFKYDEEVLTPRVKQEPEKLKTLVGKLKNRYRKDIERNGEEWSKDDISNFIKKDKVPSIALQDRGALRHVRSKKGENVTQGFFHPENKKPTLNYIELVKPADERVGTYLHEVGHALNNVRDGGPSLNELRNEFEASSIIPNGLSKIGYDAETVNMGKRFRTIQVGDGYITADRNGGRRAAKKAGIDSEMMKELRKMKKENK